jgi:hypothetical protein
MALSTSKEVPSNDEQSSGAMAAWRSLLRRSATVGALGLLTLAFSLTPSSPSGDASAADVPRSDSTGSRNDDSVLPFGGATSTSVASTRHRSSTASR